MIDDRDNFDFALSQYADGTLNELERRTLEDRLMGDAEGRLLVSDFARIDALLKDSRELPPIDFDAFAVQISRAIDAEEAYVAPPLRMPPLFFFVKPLRWIAPLAVAAAVAVAAFVGLHFQSTGQISKIAATNSGTAVIAGPSIETASASPTITIGVGPSDTLARRGDRLSLGEEAIAIRSPKVVISAAGPASNSEVRPY